MLVVPLDFISPFFSFRRYLFDGEVTKVRCNTWLHTFHISFASIYLYSLLLRSSTAHVKMIFFHIYYKWSFWLFIWGLYLFIYLHFKICFSFSFFGIKPRLSGKILVVETTVFIIDRTKHKFSIKANFFLLLYFYWCNVC